MKTPVDGAPSGDDHVRSVLWQTAWTTADWRAHFEERSAILEYDNGLSRPEAEAQAVREIYDQRRAVRKQLPGILGELVGASQRRFDPELRPCLDALDLGDARAPLWGFGWVVPESFNTYRPALEGEAGRVAMIVPAVEAGLGPLLDLVAQGLNSGRMLTRLGVALVLGADEMESARETGGSLLVFDSIDMWLRGGTRGAVVLDWKRAGRELEGVATLLCSVRLAPKLYAATRRCWPVPVIATYAPRVMRRAA